MNRKSMKQGQQEVYQGGTKKFLYSGTQSKGRQGDDAWSFTPKKSPPSASSTAGSAFDLDDVWSIKKNVALNKSKQKNDHLNLNVNTNFYSRHGGLKDKEEADSSLDKLNPSLSTTGDSRSWTTGRRGFSYSYAASVDQGHKTVQSPPTNGQRSDLTSQRLDDRTSPNGVLGAQGRYSASSQNSDLFRF